MITTNIAMRMILDLLLRGLARFETKTKEFCFDGLRYSCKDVDWKTLVETIGINKIKAHQEK